MKINILFKNMKFFCLASQRIVDFRQLVALQASGHFILAVTVRSPSAAASWWSSTVISVFSVPPAIVPRRHDTRHSEHPTVCASQPASQSQPNIVVYHPVTYFMNRQLWCYRSRSRFINSSSGHKISLTCRTRSVTGVLPSDAGWVNLDQIPD